MGKTKDTGPENLIKIWYTSLIRWIRSLLNKEKPALQSSIIKTIRSEDGRSVLLDLRRDAVGAVRTIRINSIVLEDSFLITVDNLLVLNKIANPNMYGAYALHGSGISRADTHRIAISLILIGTSRPSFIGIWDANLIRFGMVDEDAGAKRLVYVLALRLLMSLTEEGETECPALYRASWWEDRLRSLISVDFGPYHVANLKRVK